jgi:hypothetical protein
MHTCSSASAHSALAWNNVPYPEMHALSAPGSQASACTRWAHHHLSASAKDRVREWSAQHAHHSLAPINVHAFPQTVVRTAHRSAVRVCCEIEAWRCVLSGYVVQMWAGVGLDGWEDMVWDAKARFLSATCKEKDVLEALRNHICSSDLHLPIEEKPVVTGGPLLDAEAVVAAAGKPSEKQVAKGLPALAGKKKKKGGANKTADAAPAAAAE